MREGVCQAVRAFIRQQEWSTDYFNCAEFRIIEKNRALCMITTKAHFGHAAKAIAAR